MAIFSLIVAVSLITTNLAGIVAFHIPPELLGLLGLSQSRRQGRAGTSPYQELDKTLTDVRTKEGLYLAAKTDKQKDPDAALRTLREAVQQAASMFGISTVSRSERIENQKSSLPRRWPNSRPMTLLLRRHDLGDGECGHGRRRAMRRTRPVSAVGSFCAHEWEN